MAKTGFFLYFNIYRCGLQKGRLERRTTLRRSHPAPSAVNPKITNNFFTKTSCLLTFRPIAHRPERNILDWKREKIPRPCDGYKFFIAIWKMSAPSSHHFLFN